MAFRQLSLYLGQAAWPSAAVGERVCILDGFTQAIPELGRIRVRGMGPAYDLMLAVGFDERHVDAIHGRAAHETQCP